ncbi:MAG: hypothetical protein AAFY33_18935 [Cyanobacteria bacterium J06643_4]
MISTYGRLAAGISISAVMLMPTAFAQSLGHGVLQADLSFSDSDSDIDSDIDAVTYLAQTSYYYAGEATGGEQILVDLNSIAVVSDSSANFSYLLGDEQIESQAHCVGSGAWTTLSDATVHYAQSQATRDMVRIVCSYSRSALAAVDELEADLPGIDGSALAQSMQEERAVQTALVYDPSSNVRATPNGQILCSVDTVSYINIFGRLGDWYRTDACGTLGLIHISQISFE